MVNSSPRFGDFTPILVWILSVILGSALCFVAHLILPDLYLSYWGLFTSYWAMGLVISAFYAQPNRAPRSPNELPGLLIVVSSIIYGLLKTAVLEALFRAHPAITSPLNGHVAIIVIQFATLCFDALFYGAAEESVFSGALSRHQLLRPLFPMGLGWILWATLFLFIGGVSEDVWYPILGTCTGFLSMLLWIAKCGNAWFDASNMFKDKSRAFRGWTLMGVSAVIGGIIYWCIFGAITGLCTALWQRTVLARGMVCAPFAFLGGYPDTRTQGPAARAGSAAVAGTALCVILGAATVLVVWGWSQLSAAGWARMSGTVMDGKVVNIADVPVVDFVFFIGNVAYVITTIMGSRWLYRAEKKPATPVSGDICELPVDKVIEASSSVTSGGVEPILSNISRVPSAEDIHNTFGDGMRSRNATNFRADN